MVHLVNFWGPIAGFLWGGLLNYKKRSIIVPQSIDKGITMKKIFVVLGLFLIFSVTLPNTASATSQWARKYGVSCTLCHQGFPRLNSFGEAFMRNGYQMPGEEDGKAERLALDNISNILGFRLNLTPVSAHVRSKTIVYGNPNWAQFFIAGSITKNVSIFIENEITTSGAHFSWYKMGFHNLFGTKALNVTVGNLSALDHSSFSNRLRITPPEQNEFFGIKPSRGKGEASVNASSARPGAMLYGDLGAVTYYAGVSSGVVSPTSNDTLNTWVGARYNINTRPIADTNFSLTYYKGTDVKNGGKDSQVNNHFYWVIPAFNLRSGNFDLQAAARVGHEDNYLLAKSSEAKADGFLGYGFVAAYMFNDRWQSAVLYDNINSGDIVGAGSEWLTTSLSYFPADNIRIAGYYKRDVINSGKNDKAYCNIRVMF